MSEQGRDDTSSGPSWTEEVGTRIQEAIDRVGTIAQASIIIGVTPETLSKWRDGKARPSYFGLVALARAADLPVDWFVGGDGADAPSRRAIDQLDGELLGRVTDMIARTYKDARISLSPLDLGRLSAEKYSIIVNATAEPSERVTMVKLLSSQLKAELLTSEPGSGKRSA